MCVPSNLSRNPHKICAAIITYAQETIACFKFVLDVGFPETYLVFDPHARPYRPSSSGFMISKSKDAVASALARLCTIIKPLMERTYFGSHLFSVHILLPRNSYRDYNTYQPSDSNPPEVESNEENSSASRLEDQRFSVTEVEPPIIPNPLPELSTNPLGTAPLFWQPETDFGRELLFELDSIAPPACIPSFECGICLEEHEVRKGVMITDCEHPFCRDCLLGHVKTKLTENQYPIRCPTCSTERGRLDPGGGFYF